MSDGHFPGLKALIESTPKNGTVAGVIKNAVAYKWDEAEKRWVDDPSVEQEHWLKFPGEEWKRIG